MDISVRLDHPDATFTNGDIVHGEIVLYCPGTTTISRITAGLSGEASSCLSSLPGLWICRKHEEEHRFAHQVLDMIPRPSRLDEVRDESIRLNFGYHSFPFDLQIPWNAKCLSCSLGFPSPVGDPSEHRGTELPPSMETVPKEATISYRIDICVTILRNMFKSTLRKRVGIKIWPIDTRCRSAFNLPPGQITSPASVRASIMDPHTSHRITHVSSQDYPPTTNCVDPVHIMISASFLPDFSLTCGRDVTMQITTTKLTNHECEIYLQSFQMLLVGYTDIRAGTMTHGRMGFWMIQSLSNLGVKVGMANDAIGTMNAVDPLLWRGKTLPKGVIPSFGSCNIELRYELEILLGFQSRPPKSRVFFVQLRVPVRVFSGIRPGRRLSVASRSSFEGLASFSGASNGTNDGDLYQSGQLDFEATPVSYHIPPVLPTYEEALEASKAEETQRNRPHTNMVHW